MKIMQCNQEEVNENSVANMKLAYIASFWGTKKIINNSTCMEPHVSWILSTSQLLCINLCGIHQLHGYEVANKAHSYIPVASQLHAWIPVAM